MKKSTKQPMQQFGPDAPQPGEMALYDAMTPPLLGGTYKMSASADVRYDGGTGDITAQDRYFTIEGPRFRLPADLVAGVFPPRNGHGGFQDSLPHIALSRRTLPWERDPGLSESEDAASTSAAGGEQALPTLIPNIPWLALLLFEDGEYTITANVPVRQVVGDSVFQALEQADAVPAHMTCDELRASMPLVQAIMPSIEELKLLTHVREINVDYKELSAGNSNGFFSVVIGNRLPEPNKHYRACLVSVEQRADLVTDGPLPFTDSGGQLEYDNYEVPDRVVGEIARDTQASPPVDGPSSRSRAIIGRSTGAEVPPTAGGIQGGQGTTPTMPILPPTVGETNAPHAPPPIEPPEESPDNYPVLHGPSQLSVGLVLLYSWQFSCADLGTFAEIARHLDDGLIGMVKNLGHPTVTDTGHVPLGLRDRAGALEQVWYRGPLVPLQLSRDTLGPYHVAEQARRVMPEMGAEDISYAAAFELGRLLAMADGRLAVELMRWRREAFRQSARADTLRFVPAALRATLPSDLASALQYSLAPALATGLVQRIARWRVPAADPYQLAVVRAAIGLNARALSAAWPISESEAAAFLNPVIDARLESTAGIDAPTSAPLGSGVIDLDGVASDIGGMAALRGFFDGLDTTTGE
jgi:hypothetical protein